jgi:hypothetical protein
MDMFDKLIRANHWNEGVLAPDVILSPSAEAPVIGAQENCPAQTGLYLAALSFRFAATQDPQVRTAADSVMDGILKLEKITGERGCIARGFNKTSVPLSDREKAFLAPQSWNESLSQPDYRWMGDISAAQLTPLIFGVSTYWEFCADDAHKTIAAGFIERVIGRCISNNMRVIDIDGKMTRWGNLCPDMPHDPLNGLLMLYYLKTTFKITGKQSFETGYNRLLIKYKYDDEALQAKSIQPAETPELDAGRLASIALCGLIRFEEKPDLVAKYRSALDKYWNEWKDSDEPWTRLIRQMLTNENCFDDKTSARLKQLAAVVREKAPEAVQTPNGQPAVEIEYENIDMWVLPSYWLARKIGAIDPQQ